MTLHDLVDVDKKKSKGPRTEPCGTPEMTGSGVEVSPFRTTDWYLFVR